MTEIELCDGLKERLQSLFRGYTLLNRAGTLQEINIYNQYVPQPAGVTIRTRGMDNYSDSDYDNYFPCIIIQSKESKYMEERMLSQASHAIRLLIGIYDSESVCQGWRDIANVEDRLLNDLFMDRVIANKFRLEMPVTFKFVDVDTWPIYFGEILMTFTIGRAMQRHSYIHEMKGGYIS